MWPRMLPFTIRVPATTANLGPGFDLLGLALDLWNEVEVAARDEPGMTCKVVGFGQDELPEDASNVVLQAAGHLFGIHGQPPAGLHFECRNHIPPGSGMGSSSAAILSGLLAANQVLERPTEQGELMSMAARLEGHPDNVTAGLLGGLTVAVSTGNNILARKKATAPWWVAMAVPDIDRPTVEMRNALPLSVPHADAVFNLGRAVLVMEALVAGDLPLLRRVMEDRLHQPFRMPLIPGAREARAAAFEAGGAAALSGAGPGIVAFAYSQESASEIAAAMSAAFSKHVLDTWTWVGQVSDRGGHVNVLEV